METKSRVLVIGGGSGTLGSAIARALYRNGAAVALTYFQNAEKAHALSKELQDAPFFCCDLKNQKSIKNTLTASTTKLGGLTSVVQAAGIADFVNFDDATSEQFFQSFEINVTGTFFAFREAAEILKKNPDGGNLITIGTLSGIKLIKAPPALASSKAATKGLIEALAKEWGPANIKINSVAPGLTSAGSSLKVAEDDRKSYLQHCSLGRLGDPKEIAQMVAWLAMNNTFITGQSLVLDGGL